MFIGIIYILTVIFLFYSFIKIKKTDKKINFIFTLFISFILLFCYNSLVGYILNLFYIPINLISLSIINFIIGTILNIKIFKTKEKQKYKIEKTDVFSTIIFLVVIVLIGIFRFGFPFEIVYETSDPGVHFWTSLDFYRHSSLLNHVVDPIVDFSTRQFASYLNVGILFKIFSPFIGEASLFNIYVLFDLFMLFMSLEMFYILLRLICKKLNKFILIFASILYMLGYPLNNMIFGFFYSGHAIIIINLILILMYVYKNKLIDDKKILLYLTFINIGLFFTYYFYVPVVFISIFIMFIIQNKGSFFNRKFILQNLFVLGLPCVLGLIYFIVPNIGNDEMNFINQINLDGYFYNDVISNFILFIPIVIYYFIINIKEKKFDFELILFSVLILCMMIFNIIIFSGNATFYYLSKFYYVLWFIMFVISLQCLNKIENKTVIDLYCILYLIFTVFSIFNIENKVYQKNDLVVNRRVGTNILDIYYYNFDKLKNRNIILDENELKIIKDIYKLNPNDIITNNSVLYQRIWIDALFKKEKINYPENQLYTFIFNEYYYDPLDYNLYTNFKQEYNYYLIFYRKNNFQYYVNCGQDISSDVCNKLVQKNNSSKYINYSEKYDTINRDTCENCKFYDYNVGMLIIK